MHQRSSWQICAPFAADVLACAIDDNAGLVASGWIGVVLLLYGARPGECFPRTGLSHSWFVGFRAGLLRFYHLAWWPHYLWRDSALLRARRRPPPDGDSAGPGDGES
jgi:hypothetical protein